MILVPWHLYDASSTALSSRQPCLFPGGPGNQGRLSRCMAGRISERMIPISMSKTKCLNGWRTRLMPEISADEAWPRLDFILWAVRRTLALRHLTQGIEAWCYPLLLP